jgi:hypothetical protein
VKRFFLTVFLSLAAAGFPVPAQDLNIVRSDLRIELRADGGFHLFIRKKPGIASILLTESTRDPSMQSDNYAYRAGEWNPVNGDEIRLINGMPLSKGLYSLVSSTPAPDEEFGEAFHIYLPYILYYGYETGRHGEVYLMDGTYLNIRTFEFPYADYRGSFKDNPFMLEARQLPPEGIPDPPPEDLPAPPPEGKYLKEAAESFAEVARSGGGDLIYAAGTDDLTDKLRTALEKEKGKNVDIVLCLDTTGSMKKYIDPLRLMLVPMLRELAGSFASFRIGMVLYKDYYEQYLTRVIPFTDDFAKFQRDLDAVRVQGGGDIPEAVYEALYAGATGFPWEAESRLMFLAGDAPAHPKPRRNITKEMAFKAAEEKGIKVNAVIFPNK